MATSPNEPQTNRKRTASAVRGSGSPYAELHAVSNFSFLRGASHPEELVRTAHDLGYRAIAITDECSVAGAVKAHLAARELDIKLIVGAEFRIPGDVGDAEENIHLVLLAPDRRAYGQLSQLVTRARRRAPKGEYELNVADLEDSVEDCLALWIPNRGSFADKLKIGHKIKQLLPHLWITLELFLEHDDLDKAAHVLTLSSRLGLPTVASNGACMHVPQRQPLRDALTAIRLKTTVRELGTRIDQNRERHLRPLARLVEIYPREMLDETLRIAERCAFSLDELRYEYPRELVPPGLTPARHLRQLAESGAKARWPGGTPPQVVELIDKELELVADLGYEYFFLTVHDIVRFAKGRGILCQGRGSAANSAVCYCLGITEVDPARMHLLFERFVSKERDEPPDIDVDFEHERREEVIQYIYERYGRDRAALAATLITYRPRSAIRDMGKALGLDPDLVDLLAKSMAWWDKRSELDRRLKAAGVDPQSRTTRQFLFLVNEILGFPRHLSQHVGGFVISAGPLAQLVPIENAAMPERTVIQWDKDDLEALNLLKVDVLGLGMLTAIRKTLALIASQSAGLPPGDHSPVRIDQVPPEDPETYAMLQHGDSVGVFQVESRAQMSMLPRLKPASFYDLVIEVAIVRPGPIQGNMVHPYLRRRQGLEPVAYANDAVRRVLERTLGIPIFQEQVIELAMVAAGFTAGEADQLRRAMAAWRRRGGLERFEGKLINGMLERGLDRAFAERVFEQIKGFGEYGFPESHAASFALLVYVSAWLKRHQPAAFYCGILNSLPMGFYSPSQLVQDAVAHGLEVRPADVQRSGWDYRLETPAKRIDGYRVAQPALRLGLRQVKGLGEEVARRIEGVQPFRDIDDLNRRAELDDRALTFLARAGALESLSGHRYQAHWDAAGVDRPTPLWEGNRTPYQTDVALASPGKADDMLADYRYLGLTLGPHPMALLRDEPEFHGCRTAGELAGYRHEQFVQVAGVVTCRQRPGSATGVVFMTLEDETGNSNIVVWNSVLERFRAALLQSRLIAVKGVVEREGEVIHVVAGAVRDLSHKLAELSSPDGEAAEDNDGAAFKSRNFH